MTVLAEKFNEKKHSGCVTRLVPNWVIQRF